MNRLLPYAIIATLSASIAGILFAASLSSPATMWLNEHLAIDPFTAAGELVVLFVVAVVLALSPSARSLAVAGVSRAWVWLIQKPEQPSRTSNSGWPLLAGVRFVLAAIVLCLHLNNTCFAMKPGHWCYYISQMGGFAAVMGFFLISGYSMAASVGRDTVKRFYRRRFWRIFPLFWSAFFYALLPFIFFGPHVPIGSGGFRNVPDHFGAYILNALCLQTLIWVPIVTFNASWSLFPEVTYYALAPLFKKAKTWLLLVLVGVSAVGLFEYIQIGSGDVGSEPFGINLACLVWAWLLGFIYYRHRGDRRLALLMLALPAYLVWKYTFFSNGPLGWLTVLLTACAIIAATYVKLTDQWQKILEWAGDVSYPLYLCHLATFEIIYPVLYHVYGRNFGTTSGTALLLASMAFIVAVMMYHLIDKPIRAFASGRSRRVASDATAP